MFSLRLSRSALSSLPVPTLLLGRSPLRSATRTLHSSPSPMTVAPTPVNVLRSVREVRQWRRAALLQNQTVGLVPTMGALHQGHLNLIGESINNNDHTIISVFVNPSQFAPHEDLDAYPRTLDADLAALATVASPRPLTVFLPTVAEMYPNGIPLEQTKQRGAFVEVKGLSEQLEGSVRPQFFRGVATVVAKLLNIMTPDTAYFGQKDIQQVVVVKRLVQDLLFATNIVMVPTTREHNLLAMSSRNAYLSDDSRMHSGVLYRALAAGEAAYKAGTTSRAAILDAIRLVIKPYERKATPDQFGVHVEYISLADPVNLQEVETVDPAVGAILSSAIRVPNKLGTETRIIDNIIL